MSDTPHDLDPKVPNWLIEMEYEAGDDLADFDAFECDRCHEIWDIEDSIAAEGEDGRELLCPICAR